MAAPPSALCALSLRDALPILTGALGTVAEQQAGVYTGRLVGEMLHGPGKAVAVEELAVREGLDLTRCYAYSDSATDRKSTRLNSSHVAISYAVFCLKKKKYVA